MSEREHPDEFWVGIRPNGIVITYDYGPIKDAENVKYIRADLADGQVRVLRGVLKSLDERLRQCMKHPISAAEAYDSFYRAEVADALAQTEPKE